MSAVSMIEAHSTNSLRAQMRPTWKPTTTIDVAMLALREKTTMAVLSAWVHAYKRDTPRRVRIEITFTWSEARRLSGWFASTASVVAVKPRLRGDAHQFLFAVTARRSFPVWGMCTRLGRPASSRTQAGPSDLSEKS